MSRRVPLAERRCRSCRGETNPLDDYARATLAMSLPAWDCNSDRLERTFRFPDYVSILAWIAEVGRIAEEQGHHPEICFTWGRAQVRIWTHSVGAVTENDFILAAKIDRIAGPNPVESNSPSSSR